MPPTSPELLELTYASKLLAKIIDAVDEKVVDAIDKIEAQQDSVNRLRETVASLDKRLELLPHLLSEKLDSLIEKRTTETFEDLRVTLDEMRNKLWAIKKQIKESTGAHALPNREQVIQWERDKEKENGDGVSIKKGKFRMDLPFSEGTWKVLKVVGVILLALAGSGAATGGIWVLIDHVRHALSGGG